MGKSEKKPGKPAKKAKPGRPPADSPRNLKLPGRVNQQEINKVRADAAARGMGVSEHIRDRLDLPSTGYGEGV